MGELRRDRRRAVDIAPEALDAHGKYLGKRDHQVPVKGMEGGIGDVIACAIEAIAGGLVRGFGVAWIGVAGTHRDQIDRPCGDTRLAERFEIAKMQCAARGEPMFGVVLRARRIDGLVRVGDRDHGHVTVARMGENGKGAAARGGVAVVEADLDGLKQDLQAEFQEDVDGDATVVAEVDALAGRKPDAEARGLISGLKTAKMLAAIAYRVIRRHIRGRDHGFYPTVVEELLRELYLADLGAWVWGRMKEKAAAMWLPNDGLSGDERRVGSYVLERIAALQAARPDFRVNLVGHSAGSIAICELLRAAAARSINVQVNTIAFLAPAGRSELGVTELVRHPDRFKRFRCYTMRDDYEREDRLVPGVYTRSLLYFISGVLEPDEVDAPLMGMMRHASGQSPFETGPAADWAGFMTAQQRLVLSNSTKIDPGAVAGRRTSSHSHGGFDDDGLTRESLTELLRV